jgi:hypothetical protein
MKILIKFPTRSRPEKFLNVLRLYVENMESPHDNNILVTCDVGDTSMNNDHIKEEIKRYSNVNIQYLHNKSKIEAVNNGLPLDGYDIILLASDDMIPVAFGYDNIIRKTMIKYFPDTDGVLWFNDGIQGMNFNTLCILGKKYYDRFGYIYHPSYKSYYCDNEFTYISKKLERVIYCNDVIIRHVHHCMNPELIDDLYKFNDQYAEQDKLNWEKRQKGL